MKTRLSRSAAILLIATVTVLAPACNVSGQRSGSGHIIPAESSILRFRVTESSDDGKHWLYGEDEQYYYSTALQTADAPYIKIAKSDATEKSLFRPDNYLSWNDQYLCDVLLEIHASRPPELEFLACGVSYWQGSVEVESRYRVPGSQSYAVEAYMRDHFGMTALAPTGDGFQARGPTSSFQHDTLTAYHPNMIGKTTMFSGKYAVENGQITGINRNTNRDDIDYFFVRAWLLIE